MLAWVPGWLRWVFASLVLVVVLVYLVIPQFGEAEEALGAVAAVNGGYVVLGGLLVAAAIAAQTQLTRSVLPEAERLSFTGMGRIELATTAVSHTVPGGTAAGTTLAFRLLRRAGVSRSSTGFALGARAIGSALVLNVILWSALVVSIPTQGFDPRYTTAAVLAVALLGLVGALVAGILGAQAGTTRVLCRAVRPIPFVQHQQVPAVVDRLARDLRNLLRDRRVAVRAVGWATAYWVALALALWVLLHAFGWTGPPIAVVVAFGVVNVLAAVPVTPRGLGILEAVLIPMLIGFGAPASTATLGVISWRLLSFWAPIPLGTLSYVSLRIRNPSIAARPPREIASELGDHARSARESLSEWAQRHALGRQR